MTETTIMSSSRVNPVRFPDDMPLSGSSGHAVATVAGGMFRIVDAAGNGWTLRIERGTLAAVQCQN
jgi:hypothetical protein